jgi:hypothetical protein
MIFLAVAETPLIKKKHRRARSGARHFDPSVPDAGILLIDQIGSSSVIIVNLRYVLRTGARRPKWMESREWMMVFVLTWFYIVWFRLLDVYVNFDFIKNSWTDLDTKSSYGSRAQHILLRVHSAGIVLPLVVSHSPDTASLVIRLESLVNCLQGHCYEIIALCIRQACVR